MLSRFWWVFVVAFGAAAYYLGWPEVKPRFDAFRAERLADDVCAEADKAVTGGQNAGEVHRTTAEAFEARARGLGITFEDHLGTPVIVSERSCRLSATVVANVNGKVVKHLAQTERLW